MGLLDRLHDSVTGLGNALEAPIGFVKDLATSPFDNRGMVDAIYHDFTDRGAQLLTGAVGPSGFTGSLIGGLPQGARAGINEFVKPAETAMDAAYTDLIGRPLSTAMEAASIAQAGHGGLSGGLFNASSWSKFAQGSTWAQAWDIAGHQSPGQSVALAFMTKDITNPAQVAKAQGSDFYHAASGLTDGLLRFYDDPTQVLAGSATGYLKELHTVDSQAAIARLQSNGAITGFANDLLDRAQKAGGNKDVLAAQIRDAYFPKAYMGGQLSSALAHAATTGTAADVERVTRIGLGATDEIEILRNQDAALAGQLDRVMQRREAVAALGPNGFGLNNTADDLAKQEAELNHLYDEKGRLDRLNLVSAAMTELPHQSLVGQAREAIKSTDFYQSSLAAKPLRVVFDAAPKHLVQYDSGMSDATLFHFMQSSDMPIDRQLELRGQFLNAQTNGARMGVARTMHDEAIQSIADSTAVVSPRKFEDWVSNVPGNALDDTAKADLVDQYRAAKGRDAKLAVLKDVSAAHELPLPGLSVNEMQQHLAMAASLRDVTKKMLDGRKYDGEGRSIIQLEDEHGIGHHVQLLEKPLYETQLADMDALPDLRQYRSVATKTGQFRALHPTTDLPAELAQAYYNVWKPTTLLRVGAPVRIVSDEGLRSIAKIGALFTAKNMAAGASDMVKDTAAYALGKVGINLERSARGAEPLLVNGYALEGAFGAPGDGANIYKYLSKARETFGREMTTSEGGIYDDLVKSGDFRSLSPTDAEYGQQWMRDVNLQIGNSKLGKQMLAAKLSEHPEGAVEQVTKWLRSTPEGQTVARDVGRTNYQEWAQAVSDQIDSYLPTTTLKEAAQAQTATHQLLADQVPNLAEQPIIHGEALAQDLGHSKITKAYNTIVDKGFDTLFDKPSQYLIRNPFMDHMYSAEVRRQIQLLTGEKEYGFAERMVRRAAGLPEQSAATGLELSAQDLERVQYRARQYALNQTKDLFHDFSQRSELGHMLRFVSPFFSAWQQILSRWAGLAVENPGFIRRMDMLWRAPEKAGVVTDGAGNVLDENDNISHPVAGGMYKAGQAAADNQRNITLPIPSWAKDVPVVGKGLAAAGELKFGKDSINLLLHGFPTVGPLAQVPLNEIAKSRPDAAAALKWALPYGPSQNSFDILKPTIMKHVQQEAEGDANRSYAYTVLRLYNDQVVDFNLGKRATPPTFAEAEGNAKAFWHMKTLAGFTLPVTPQFVSPYQAYIDAYRSRLTYDGTLTAAQKAQPDYVDPKEWFLKTYGPEFFPLTTSMSKSVDGIPPTVAGFQIRDQYKGLLAKYPELGSLIVGQTGAGSFSQAVYDSQFQTHVSPGGPTERQVQSQQDFAKAPNTELGWIQFSKTMDMIDGLRVQRGLTSLNAKGAADLLAMKQNLVYNLAQKYPSWFEDYASSDSSKWDQRIAGMTAIVNTKGMEARPEFQGLQQYLAGRKDLISVLEAAKSHNLSAKANEQLAAQWDQFTANLVAQNPAFAALYYRWLQNDPVPVTPITELAQSGQLNPSAPTGQVA